MMPPGEPAADFQVASYGKPDPEMLTTQHQTERKPRLRKQPDFFSVTGSNGKTHICCCCPEMRGQTNVKKPGGQPLGFLSLGIPCHLETRRVPLRLVNLFGIESPGLTSAMSLAEEVVQLVMEGAVGFKN
jgi:hypothetical protein